MKKLSVIVLAALGLAGIAHAETVTYNFDPTHTFATFEIGHFGTSTNRGRFNKTEGSVELDKAAKTGKLSVTVHADSLDTGFAQFTKHISSNEMLDVATYPTATFAGDKFTFNGDKVTDISGALTLHGKTNPVTLPEPDAQARGLRRRLRGHDRAQPVRRELRPELRIPRQRAPGHPSRGCQAVGETILATAHVLVV